MPNDALRAPRADKTVFDCIGRGERDRLPKTDSWLVCVGCSANNDGIDVYRSTELVLAERTDRMSERGDATGDSEPCDPTAGGSLLVLRVVSGVDDDPLVCTCRGETSLAADDDDKGAIGTAASDTVEVDLLENHERSRLGWDAGLSVIWVS